MNNQTSRTVLIIEDEPDMLRGLKDAIEFEGYSVLSAATGQDGIDRTRDMNFFTPAFPLRVRGG